VTPLLAIYSGVDLIGILKDVLVFFGCMCASVSYLIYYFACHCSLELKFDSILDIYKIRHFGDALSSNYLLAGTVCEALTDLI